MNALSGTGQSDPLFGRALEAFIRQEFSISTQVIVEVAELLIDDARRDHDDALLEDLTRIRTAGLSLQQELHRLVALTLRGSASAELDLAQFKAKLRHDLRTPLNAVKGYSELIIEDARDNGREQLLNDAEKMVAAAQQLLKQVDRLVAMTDSRAIGTRDSLPLFVTSQQDLVGQVIASIGPARSRHRSQPSSILVVDDILANRELLSRRLSRDGHGVCMVDGGASALELIAQTPFDLVLLDLMMPDMNGFEVLLRLKEDPALRNIPVIMISALDEIDSTVRCIEAGAEDYIPKPFNPVLLTARIEATLERKRLRDREQAFTDQLRIEKNKSDALLLNILPAGVVERMRLGEVAIADRFPDATILFADLVGFTGLASGSSPARIIEILNHLFSDFDALAKSLKLEKIKTIGDAYLLAGGLPDERPDHAIAVADMALGMIEIVRETGKRFEIELSSRIGIHSGDVVAGIIGQHRFIYDVWGDTVNTASRLESSSQPDRIQISEVTYKRVAECFRCEPRGHVEIKGKGRMPTYFLGPRF
ncbi:adenylate/guanylate cyclase domain-containing protein [Bradyrhizobium genosp. A]|uniref:adenylate/guanylate cyclase domain-containing protein n=1 Tax=Bradyrhizobium genosp. A TaxID=83626 RepID=UPI003CF1E324